MLRMQPFWILSRFRDFFTHMWESKTRGGGGCVPISDLFRFGEPQEGIGDVPTLLTCEPPPPSSSSYAPLGAELGHAGALPYVLQAVQ